MAKAIVVPLQIITMDNWPGYQNRDAMQSMGMDKLEIRYSERGW